MVAVGLRRFRVLQWLADDPYPRAEVEDWPDEPCVPDPQVYRDTIAALRRALALANELGESTAPSTVELSADPEVGSFQLATLAPLTPLDKQALLRTPSAADRIDLAQRALAEVHELLTLRLGMTGPGDGG